MYSGDQTADLAMRAATHFGREENLMGGAEHMARGVPSTLRQPFSGGSRLELWEAAVRKWRVWNGRGSDARPYDAVLNVRDDGADAAGVEVARHARVRPAGPCNVEK